MNTVPRLLEPLDPGDLDAIPIPPAVAALIDDARARTQRFLHERARAGRPIPAFVPGDAGLAYRMLAAIVGRGLARGRRFCEWGSGLGVATCIASTLGLEACGIEIEPALVDEARALAAAHGIDAHFVTGSYCPAGTAAERVRAADLTPGLGFSPLDFDIIHAYPWPAEERRVRYLFGSFAAPGTLLATYHGGHQVALWRRGPAPAPPVWPTDDFGVVSPARPRAPTRSA